MRWPWTKLEARDSSYTDALVSLIVEQSSGATLAAPAATAALEASASIVARCFASADVSAPDQYREALGPSTLSLIGRSLIRDGEAVFAIEIRDGRVVPIPAASWDVEGEHDPASWRYRLTLGGPSRLTTLEPVPHPKVRAWCTSGSRAILKRRGGAFLRWPRRHLQAA